MSGIMHNILSATFSTTPVLAGTYWQDRFNTVTNTFSVIGADSSGNVYAAWAFTVLYAIKFNAAGAVQWTQDLGAVSSSVGVFSGAVSAAGEAYFVTTGDNTNPAIIFKLTTAGAISWQKTYSLSPSSTLLSSPSICLDSTGVPFVLLNNSSGSAFVIKLTTAGAISWQKTLTFSFLPSLYTAGISTDGSNVYVAISDPTNTLANVTKFNSAGTLQYNRDISGATFTGFSSSISADSAGNLYLLVKNKLQKWDSSGVLAWERTVALPFFATSIIADATTGDVYFTLSTITTPDSSFYPTILKFDTSGATSWQRKITNASGFSYRYDPGNMLFLTSSSELGFGGLSVVNSVFNVAVWKVPTDGSKTGTYNGAIYAADTKTITSTSTNPSSAGTAVVTTPAGTLSNSTNTATPTSFTHTLTPIT